MSTHGTGPTIIDRVELHAFTYDAEGFGRDPHGVLVCEPGARQTVGSCCLVIRTADGARGAYVPSHSAKNPAILGQVAALAPRLVGRDAFGREAIWADMKRAQRHLAAVGLSAIDVCLWDLAGRATGQSIGRMLGGYRTALPTYASSVHADRNGALHDKYAFADFARHCRDLGYRGFKIHGWAEADPREEAENLLHVAAAIGRDMALMIDPARSLRTFADALYLGRACDEAGCTWYEDPFSDTGVAPAAHRRLRELIRTLGISYRDDSILVDWYVTTYSKTWTVRSPELFEDVWQKVPTVFELEHYGSVKGKGNWVPRPGSSLARFGGGKTGADFFKGALELLHATYIGYHGYAGEWQADNPALTGELLNRCGYWFFPLSASVPERLVAGRPNAVSIEWLNRGVAPAYHAYTLVLRLRGPGSYESEQPANNQRWLPSGAAAAWPEAYQLSPPASLPVGTYALAMKLRSPEAGRDVALPLKEGRRDADGFYLVGEVQLAR
jgi:hypothetical protein